MAESHPACTIPSSCASCVERKRQCAFSLKRLLKSHQTHKTCHFFVAKNYLISIPSSGGALQDTFSCPLRLDLCPESNEHQPSRLNSRVFSRFNFLYAVRACVPTRHTYPIHTAVSSSDRLTPRTRNEVTLRSTEYWICYTVKCSRRLGRPVHIHVVVQGNKGLPQLTFCETSPLPCLSFLAFDNWRHLCSKLVHEGVSPDEKTGAILTPIVMSTTFVQESVESYLVSTARMREQVWPWIGSCYFVCSVGFRAPYGHFSERCGFLFLDRLFSHHIFVGACIGRSPALSCRCAIAYILITRFPPFSDGWRKLSCKRNNTHAPLSTRAVHQVLDHDSWATAIVLLFLATGVAFFFYFVSTPIGRFRSIQLRLRRYIYLTPVIIHGNIVDYGPRLSSRLDIVHQKMRR